MDKADDLRLWRVFLLLANRQNLTDVAAELGVEISTVSRAVSTLEKALGHKLFIRSSRPVALTDAGKTAREKIRSVLQMHDGFLDEIRQDSSVLSGEIRLVVSRGFVASSLAFHLDAFNKLHPNISFRISTDRTLADLLQNRCDILVKTGAVSSEDVIALYRGHNLYFPLASPAYVRARGLPRTPLDLGEHTVYLYSGSVRGETDFLSKGDRIEPVCPRNVIRFPSINAVKQAVLDGLGVALDIPQGYCVREILNGTLIPVLPGWYRTPLPIYTVVSKSAWMIRRVRVFAQWFNTRMKRISEQEREQLRACLLEKYDQSIPVIESSEEQP